MTWKNLYIYLYRVRLVDLTNSQNVLLLNDGIP